MLHALVTTAAQLDYVKPRWIGAKTFPFSAGAVVLIVFRSIGLRDTDPYYRPVLDIMGNYRVELLSQVRVPNAQTMDGEGEWGCYMVRTLLDSSIRDLDFEPLPESFKTELRAGAEILLNELTSAAS